MVTLIQDYRLLNTGIPRCVTFGGKAFVVYLSSADRPSGCWVDAWCCQDKYPSNVILEMSLFSSAGVNDVASQFRWLRISRGLRGFRPSGHGRNRYSSTATLSMRPIPTVIPLRWRSIGRSITVRRL